MRETPKARDAWTDYLGMGPGRSIDALHRLYLVRLASGQSTVPTRHVRVLERWSTRHGWQARIRAIQDAAAREAEEREAAYRRGIMEEGYALAHERVKTLKQVAGALVRDIGMDSPDPRLWVRDIKGIGAGDNYREVIIERFNAAEIEQLRGLLDDIAREKGERRETKILAGDPGAPLTVHEIVVNVDEAAP